MFAVRAPHPATLAPLFALPFLACYVKELFIYLLCWIRGNRKHAQTHARTHALFLVPTQFLSPSRPPTITRSLIVSPKSAHVALSFAFSRFLSPSIPRSGLPASHGYAIFLLLLIDPDMIHRIQLCFVFVPEG
eukprot:3192318-Rhodomonas_salina.1